MLKLSNNLEIRDYIWMDGVPVANVDTTGTTSTLAYVTADQLGAESGTSMDGDRGHP
jgi:hypothetical protein